MMFASVVCFSLRESGYGKRVTCLLGGNPDGANPDRNACHVSSGGGVPTIPTKKWKHFYQPSPEKRVG